MNVETYNFEGVANIANPVGDGTRGSLTWLKGQASKGIPIWAVCENCDHSRLIDTADLMALVKPGVAKLAELSQRMRCRACNSKACELRAASPIPEYFG